jgi:hypothetical protein
MSNEVNLVEVKLVKEYISQDCKSKYERIESFDIERIPSQVFQPILEKVLPKIGVTDIKLENPSDYETLIQLVYSIVKVIAKIISPIAQNAQKSNSEKIVSEKGIKYFKSLINFDRTEDSQNYSLSDYQAILQWKSENDFFKYLACSAVLETLGLKDVVFTLDALHAQKKLCIS